MIVGTGHSGLAAAITAADAGAKVVILEKMKKEFEGGNSKVSGNMWWTPTDLPQALQYIGALSYGLTDKECIQALAEEMLKLNDWLQKLGITAGPLGIFQPEHPELPGAACVRTWTNGMGDARLWTPLREQVTKRNVEVMYETPAKTLIQTPSGEIAGIRAEVAGKSYFIMAKKGVILCCGGFEFDFEMQKNFLPGWPIYCQGSPGNTGDGIRMAQQAGAALWHMNNPLGWLGWHRCAGVCARGHPRQRFRRIHLRGQVRETFHVREPSKPPRVRPEGIPDVLRRRGRRFHPTALLLRSSTTRRACAARSLRPPASLGGSAGTRIIEWSRDNSKEIEKGWIIKGETVTDLAAKLGMKPEDLDGTITKYNENCKKGVDPDFDRPGRNLVAIEKAPLLRRKAVPDHV